MKNHVIFTQSEFNKLLEKIANLENQIAILTEKIKDHDNTLALQEIRKGNFYELTNEVEINDFFENIISDKSNEQYDNKVRQKSRKTSSTTTHQYSKKIPKATTFTY